MKSLFVTLFAATMMVSMNSCKKTEGRGGSNSIQGTVTYDYYDHNNNLVYSENAVDHDIFIVYGESTIFNDDVPTDFNGNYIFRYLHPGSYTLFAYEDCNTCASELQKVEVAVEVSGNKQEIAAPALVLRQEIDPNDGTATITGNITTEEYNAGNQLIGEYDAADERVYIVYEDDVTYFEDMRTNQDGTYQFTDLIPGEYTIYAYSDCVSCGPSKIETRETTVTITDKGEAATAIEIIIEKRP